tara:strand:+ start:131 stop:664 length:534 start_codon:yes stop_codon:yes gene_type:complete
MSTINYDFKNHGNRDENFQTTPYYFAYGSNLYIMQMHDRCKNANAISKATLQDWRLVFRGVADVESHVGSSVEGAIYEITPSDEDRLDMYEGYPNLYTKEFATVDIDGEMADVMFYTMTSAYDGVRPPSVTYYETILGGYHHWDLDNKSLTNALLESYKTNNGRVHKPLAWKRKKYV